MIELLTIVVPNRAGQLYRVIQAISQAEVDMKALSLSGLGPDNGEVRLLVTDLPKAQAALTAAQIPSRIESAVAVVVPDRAGGLASILKVTTKAGLSIKALFTFVTHVADHALAIGCFDDNEQAESLLARAGFAVADHRAIRGADQRPTLSPPALDDYVGGSFFW
jgi:hypothetical protein